MAVFGKLSTRFKQWLQSLDKEDTWCIMVTADPDAMGAAMAFKRLLSHRAQEVIIARTNEVTRPDNLAMIRYLRVPLVPWKPEMASEFQRFALVDSQPHHNPAFQDIHFSLVIDHHPVTAEHPVEAEYVDIRPEFGATSTMLARYLQLLRIRPGRLLATALLYGIRTDTAAFERSGSEQDLKAYQWLSRHADINLLRRIVRSEYLREWLPLFSRAFRTLHSCRLGAQAYLGSVKSADMLVAIADFFTRVHGLKWVAISGVCNGMVIVIFRGDGSRDIGKLAASCFRDVGSAGGHRTLARAEFPLTAVPDGKAGEFVQARLAGRRPRCLPAPVEYGP
ncbi:MAG: DHH family phosphoesterase [Desulfovibrionaceae bacterium]|nr:DHH family phosphoesterase [Desulfovibrionaceae bacterium]